MADPRGDGGSVGASGVKAAALAGGLVAVAAALALLFRPAAQPPAPEPPFPAQALADRVERQLRADRPALKRSPSHEGLVFPVEQADLLAFMGQIRVYGDAREVVLGTDQGFESHGGGLLALLLDHWRPDGRAASLEDRFVFAGGPTALPLSTIYASHLRQIVLPEGPGLPRLRFGGSGALGPIPPVETDAYSLLSLLATRGADLEARWETYGGQETSAAALLERARAFYLAGTDAPVEPADHTELHLVEILLRASARLGSDPDALKRRFLAHELRRKRFDPEAETLILGHYAESLGVLLADARVRWSAEERSDVGAWLGWLDATHFRAPASVPARDLAHLLRGLRLARSHPATRSDGP